MKVSGHGDQHLICPSSEEVGLLVDLCHAGASSDHLNRSAARKQRLNSNLPRRKGLLQAQAWDFVNRMKSRNCSGRPIVSENPRIPKSW